MTDLEMTEETKKPSATEALPELNLRLGQLIKNALLVYSSMTPGGEYHLGMVRDEVPRPDACLMTIAPLLGFLVRTLTWTATKDEVPEGPVDCLVFMPPNRFGFARYDRDAKLWWAPGPDGQVTVMPGVTHFKVMYHPEVEP